MSLNVAVNNLSETSVRLQCTLDASPERVYRAWTTPAEFACWFTPPGARCETAQMDVRIGGNYTVTFVMPDASRSQTTGEYLTLEPYERLRFTWLGSCSSSEIAASEVTVELAPVEGKTHLTLTHERLANADSRDRHARGWNGCLQGLIGYVREE